MIIKSFVFTPEGNFDTVHDSTRYRDLSTGGGFFLKKGLQKRSRCDIILSSKKYRGIAQLVEYRSPKPWVAGSNPPAPAKK